MLILFGLGRGQCCPHEEFGEGLDVIAHHQATALRPSCGLRTQVIDLAVMHVARLDSIDEDVADVEVLWLEEKLL
eukprot:10510687-Lingulodinium_polyedra.AAC.1